MNMVGSFQKFGDGFRMRRMSDFEQHESLSQQETFRCSINPPEETT
jgi:hypothetical protein